MSDDEEMTTAGPLRAVGGKVLDILIWPAGVAVRLVGGDVAVAAQSATGSWPVHP